MRIVAILMFVIGTLLWTHARTLPIYKDEQLFQERAMSPEVQAAGTYSEIRAAMLTPRFQLEDYGITLAGFAALALFVFRRGTAQLHAPRSRYTLHGLVIMLPTLTVCGYVFDLFQALDRGEFPPWADSIGIPLMGVPIQFFLLLAWSTVHFAFLGKTFRPSASLFVHVSFKSNWWLLSVAAVTALLVMLAAVEGQYWYAIPGIFWLYFYLSLVTYPVFSEGRA